MFGMSGTVRCFLKIGAGGLMKKADPENLLKVVRCSCKSDCNSLGCSCRIHNLKCTIACTHCRGSDCRNIIEAGISIDDNTDEEI